MGTEAKRTLSDIPDTRPVRGTPGGWADPWDDPDPAILAARAVAAACALGVAQEDAPGSPVRGSYAAFVADLDVDPFPD